MNMAPAPELMVFMCVAPALEQWRFQIKKSVEATAGPRKSRGLNINVSPTW